MANLAEVGVSATLWSEDGVAVSHQPPARRFAPGSGSLGDMRQVSLTGSAFTALTVPSGSKVAILILGSATSLTLKGITGDSGIVIAPSSGPLGIDVVLPLGSAPSIGILNGESTAQTIQVLFL